MTINNTPSRRLFALAGWVLLCFAAASLGGLFGPGEWYAALKKPAWNPRVGPKPQRHHDYIDAGDFLKAWIGWPLTVEVEAKAKELAVAKLRADLEESQPSRVKKRRD